MYKFVENPFSCKKHDLFSEYKTYFLFFYINTWIKNVNKILKGLHNRNIDDKVKEAAFIEAKKHGRFVKSIATQKQLQ